MSESEVGALSREERELYDGAVERLRLLRFRAGIPDGVTLEEAVAFHMIRAEELERARWGPLMPQVT